MWQARYSAVEQAKSFFDKGKEMGNHNSTRWNGIRTRIRTDACLRLMFTAPLRKALREIETAKRNGRNGGVRTLLRSRSQGEPRAQIGLLLVGIAGGGTFAQLVYYAGSRLIEEQVDISFTTQKLGGQCAWWHCPGCKRRCGVLYCPPGSIRFRCRVCHNLCYPSQCESDKEVYALARQLGEGNGPRGDAIATLGSPGLMRYLKASTIWKRRMARHIRRDYGKRWGHLRG